jgi:hypothetical protein
MTKRFGPCGKNSRISTDSRIDEAKIGTPKDSDFLLLFGHRNSATSPKNASFVIAQKTNECPRFHSAQLLG